MISVSPLRQPRRLVEARTHNALSPCSLCSTHSVNSPRSECRLRKVVQAGGVTMDDLFAIRLGNAAEHFRDYPLRIGKRAVVVRIIGAPHQNIAAGGFQGQNPGAIILEDAFDLALEEIA